MCIDYEGKYYVTLRVKNLGGCLFYPRANNDMSNLTSLGTVYLKYLYSNMMIYQLSRLIKTFINF